MSKDTFYFQHDYNARNDEKIKNLQVVMVNESGASIYSASDVAREEFPDYDITVRGSVSIGRRLVDPLAELVKIDPSVRVLIASGFSPDTHLEEEIMRFAKGFVHKPYNISQLLTAIGSTLNGNY